MAALPLQIVPPPLIAAVAEQPQLILPFTATGAQFAASVTLNEYAVPDTIGPLVKWVLVVKLPAPPVTA